MAGEAGFIGLGFGGAPAAGGEDGAGEVAGAA
jgi:hypothetical protein